MRRFQLLIVSLLAVPLAHVRAQGTCFRGPIRPACSGFVLFEASAAAARGGTDRNAPFDVPLGNGGTTTSNVHARDLPGYYSGSLGYVRVVDPRTAIGVVGELGISNTANAGDLARFAVKGRWRRQLGTWSFDADAGPLVAQVLNVPRQGCCFGQANAYGGTMETALLYRGYGGVMAGADLIHGAGRTSGGLHAGLRVSSYTTVIAAAAAGALIGVVWWGMRNEID
jgi:hypothetical protein